MAKAVEKLSIFGTKSSQSSAPTTDHLAPEDGPPPEQPSPSESMNGAGPKSGSFEKLNAMFGGRGTMFAMPPSNGSA